MAHALRWCVAILAIATLVAFGRMTSSVKAALSPPVAHARPEAQSVFAQRLLSKYRTLMIAFQKPPNMIFTYTESRSGPSRIVTGTHRVYRDASGFQRNETLEANGSALHPPRVQTFRRATWPYHADQFAVDATDYEATFAGVASVDGRHAFVYSVKRTSAAPFEITELALDPSAGLPLRERYAVRGGGCDARGQIDFAAAGSYWLPTSVSAQCGAADPSGTSQYKDTIRFSGYQFPAAIPQDVLHPRGSEQ